MLHKQARKVIRMVRSRMMYLSSLGTAHDDASIEEPLGPERWTALYDAPPSPVSSITSEIGRQLEKYTIPGETLLETGCGTARISAELATASRRIELGDFSSTILARAEQLFNLSGLPAPRTTVCDLTKPLPWPDKSVDVVWSSGVLEHWTDEELSGILREMFRIARRRVISFVPYAGSLFYRLGKHVAESTKQWPYGRELPRATLRELFESAGACNVSEWLILDDQAINFLDYVDKDLTKVVREWWRALKCDDPVKLGQGYLLVTVGDAERACI